MVGRDLEEGDDGRFRIARRVAKDRVISSVDPDARHGHRTAARGFDGYKGHIAEDPDSEIITNTTVTPGNAGDGSVAETLVSDLVDNQDDDDTVDGDVGDEEPTVYGDSAYGGGEFQQRRGNGVSPQASQAACSMADIDGAVGDDDLRHPNRATSTGTWETVPGGLLNGDPHRRRAGRPHAGETPTTLCQAVGRTPGRPAPVLLPDYSAGS